MQYKILGSTGVLVSRICLGAMTFGDSPLGSLSREQTDCIVGQALDSGINFIDTANVYSAGASESMLGAVLGERRNQIVLATKFHSRMGNGVNDVGQSRLHLMRALEDSLRRLRTDHIDLYQVHNFDSLTPIDETLRALDDAVRSGKIRYIGCSNYSAWQLTKALGCSERHGWERFASVQSYYSLVGRDIERELIPAVADQGVSLMCWSPLAAGLLSGKIDRYGNVDPASRRARIDFPPVDSHRVFDIIDVLKTVAERHQVSAATVAQAWLLSRPAVTSVICGVTRPEHVASAVSSTSLTLSHEDLEALDMVSRLQPSYPGWIQTYNASGRVPSGYEWSQPSWRLGQPPVT